MQKEEKQLELSVEALIQRVSELKNSIAAFLVKLEHEYDKMSWPTVLDNFALLSGQLNSLGKVLKNEKVPALRNHLLLPLVLSPERDPELEKLTEGRVVMFNHEVVPDYLRTKPEPEVEEKIQQLTTKAGQLAQDQAQKQLNSLNKITSNLLDIINSARDEWENDASQKNTQPQTSSLADTNTLITTVLCGKGIKTARSMAESPTQSSLQAQQMQSKLQTSQINKAPSTIKAQIKGATSTHPYQRP